MQGSQDMGTRMQFEALRQETVDNAAATAEAQAALASFNDTMRSSGGAAAKVDQEMAKLTETFDPFQKVIEGVAGTIESELNSAFASVLDGTKTLGEALLDFASNVLAQVAQDLFAQQFSKPIAAGIAGIFSEKGNVFNSAGVTPFANGGVVSGPTIFPFANGIGLMGEAGPEAIMPLARGADGKLGVSAANGNSAPNVIINNYSGQEATASSDSAGNLVVEIGRAIAQDITSGGPSYRAIRTTFGLGNRLQQRG
jgi:lambda family phage tail tape measure protein